jgi:1-acyl-sn-glycerol-3-phosphate acyltransferase
LHLSGGDAPYGRGARPAEAGAGVFAIKTGCPIVPVFVSGTNRMLDYRGRVHRARVTVSFGVPFTLPRNADRDQAGRDLMAAIGRTRDATEGMPARRIRPHWIRKPREGSRAAVGVARPSLDPPAG